jgi:hypothetical protein
MKATTFLLLSNALSSMSDQVPDSYATDVVVVDEVRDFYVETVDYESDIKSKYEQFWTSTEICDNEFYLSSCYIDVENERRFAREKRRTHCVKQFVHKSCGAFETEVVDTDETGSEKDIEHHKTTGCTTRALSNALMVMSRMNHDIYTDLDIENGNKFANRRDLWTLTALKGAIRATTQHSHCVINAFLNYMNQCSADDFISEEDVACLSESMELDCGVDSEYNDEILSIGDHEEQLEQEEGNWHLASILNVLREATDISYAAGRHQVSTHYDYHMKESHLIIQRDDQFDLNDDLGKDVGGVQFVVPSFNDDGKMATKTTDSSIYDTCAAFFEKSKADYEASNDENTIISDKCYSVSSWSIIFLEDGNPRNMEWERVDGDKVRAKWHDVQGCGTRLTQWNSRIACCKSYTTLLEDTPAIAQQVDDYGQPIEALSGVDPKHLMYEVDVLSKDNDDGGQITIPDMSSSDSSSGMVNFLAEYVEPEESTYSSESTYVPPSEEPAPLVKPDLYLIVPEAFKEMCATLALGIDSKTVIGLTSSQCNYQSCVLSKLAKCMSEEDEYVGSGSN